MIFFSFSFIFAFNKFNLQLFEIQLALTTIDLILFQMASERVKVKKQKI